MKRNEQNESKTQTTNPSKEKAAEISHLGARIRVWRNEHQKAKQAMRDLLDTKDNLAGLADALADLTAMDLKTAFARKIIAKADELGGTAFLIEGLGLALADLEADLLTNRYNAMNTNHWNRARAHEDRSTTAFLVENMRAWYVAVKDL